MRILFDHCTPWPLRRLLAGHVIERAFQMGWADLDNGFLLAAAEPHFDLLLTVDTNLRYQQNLQGRAIAILLIPQNIDLVELHRDEFLAAVNSIQPGEYRELRW